MQKRKKENDKRGGQEKKLGCSFSRQNQNREREEGKSNIVVNFFHLFLILKREKKTIHRKHTEKKKRRGREGERERERDW